MTDTSKLDAPAHQPDREVTIELEATRNGGLLDTFYFQTVDSDGKFDQVMVKFENEPDRHKFFVYLASMFNTEIEILLYVEAHEEWYGDVYHP